MVLPDTSVPKLRRRIQESTAAVESEQAKLPAPVDHPVQDLHRTVERIGEVLKEHLTMRGDVTQRFLDLQVSFERELLASVAAFIPVLEKDTPAPEVRAPVVRTVYLDQVHALFAK